MAEPGEGREVWGDLRFERRDRLARAPEEEAAQARFWIGLGVFLTVALLYPWYAYWVQTRLFAHEVSQAMQSACLSKKRAAHSGRSVRSLLPSNAGVIALVLPESPRPCLLSKFARSR